jgi:hypothetical protein
MIFWTSWKIGIWASENKFDGRRFKTGVAAHRPPAAASARESLPGTRCDMGPVAMIEVQAPVTVLMVIWALLVGVRESV